MANPVSRLPSKVPNYAVPLLNEDGTMNLAWWRFLAGIPTTCTLVCTQETFPKLTSLIAGQFIFVSDFGHMIFWDGSAPAFADGGNRFSVFAPAAPAPIGWNRADGSTQNVLNADGSVSPVILPVSPGAFYRL